MKHYILVCLIAISLCVSSQVYYGKLALTWPPGYCQQLQLSGRKCDSTLLSKWNGHSFTIHGYWPDLVTSKTYGRFSLTPLKPIMSQLNKYYPPRFMAYPNPSRPSFTQKFFLWIHEWNTHGKDMADIYYKLDNGSLPASSAQRDQQLEFYYFDDTLRLFKALKADNLAYNPKTKAQLANLIGLPESMFLTRCNPSGTLNQIRVCTKFRKVGNRFAYTFIRCTRGSSNCPGSTINLPGFR